MLASPYPQDPKLTLIRQSTVILLHSSRKEYLGAATRGGIGRKGLGKAMSWVAAHAVRPVCPLCGGRVRSSLEVEADLSELAELTVRARSLALQGGEEESRFCAAVMCQAARELEELQAELAGAHRDAGACRSPAGNRLALLAIAVGQWERAARLRGAA